MKPLLVTGACVLVFGRGVGVPAGGLLSQCSHVSSGTLPRFERHSPTFRAARVPPGAGILSVYGWGRRSTARSASWRRSASSRSPPPPDPALLSPPRCACAARQPVPCRGNPRLVCLASWAARPVLRALRTRPDLRGISVVAHDLRGPTRSAAPDQRPPRRVSDAGAAARATPRRRASKGDRGVGGQLQHRRAGRAGGAKAARPRAGRRRRGPPCARAAREQGKDARTACCRRERRVPAGWVGWGGWRKARWRGGAGLQAAMRAGGECGGRGGAGGGAAVDHDWSWSWSWSNFGASSRRTRMGSIGRSRGAEEQGEA